MGFSSVGRNYQYLQPNYGCDRIILYDFRILERGFPMLLTILMILDAIVAIGLIAAVLGQTPKSAGMGLGGGGDTVFSSQARGMDALLARVTVVLAVIFGGITLVIAKLTM